MALPITDPGVYTDFAGLDQLKRAASGNDPAAVRAVARQFESLFARMMIQSMRESVGKDPIFGSDQEQMYQGMFDDQLSVELTRGRGLGLADMLVRQLQRMSGSSPGAAGTADGAQGGAAGATSASGVATGSGTAATASSGAQPAAAAVDPSSQTGASSQARASHTTRAAFIRSIWSHAVDAARQLGVSAKGLAAQAALETDWGQKVPRDSNGASSHNLFGIKAGGDWQGSSVASETQEYSGASANATTASFRAYEGPAQSFADYVSLLRSDPRYAAALGTGDNVGAFAAALQRGGYATDPNYARKISAVAASLPALQSASPGGGLKLADTRPINVTAGTL